MKVFIGKKALGKIEAIEKYIVAEIKMPLTAIRYKNKLIDYGFSLGDFPQKYKSCTQEYWQNKGYRCAVLNKQWVFVYEIKTGKVIIRDIVPAKLLK